MGKRKVTEANILQAIEKRDEREGWNEIAGSLGVGTDAIRKAVTRYQARQGLRTQVANEVSLSNEDVNDPRIHSLLAKAEVNLDEWEVQRAVVNEWGQAQNYQAKVWLKYNPLVSIGSKVREQLKDDVREVAAEVADLPVDLFQHVNADDDPHMVEVSAAEPHVGKLGWGEEVLDNYDSSIATMRYKACVTDLVGRAVRSYNVDEFVYVFGNDFMHIDNKQSSTTAGTLQDADTRWHKIFRTSHWLARWTIELLRRTGAPVKVVIVPGNHDELSVFAVGEVLSAAYEDVDGVTIDNRASLRKYHRYGTTLLGFTHGNEERIDQLPLIMADEARDDWSATRFNEWHVGHRHNKKALHFTSHDQFRSIGVRILPSLCGQDYWHYKKGYRHLPQSELHVWSRDRGHVATFTYTADPNHEE